MDKMEDPSQALGILSAESIQRHTRSKPSLSSSFLHGVPHDCGTPTSAGRPVQHLSPSSRQATGEDMSTPPGCTPRYRRRTSKQIPFALPADNDADLLSIFTPRHNPLQRFYLPADDHVGGTVNGDYIEQETQTHQQQHHQQQQQQWQAEEEEQNHEEEEYVVVHDGTYEEEERGGGGEEEEARECSRMAFEQQQHAHDQMSDGTTVAIFEPQVAEGNEFQRRRNDARLRHLPMNETVMQENMKALAQMPLEMDSDLNRSYMAADTLYEDESTFDAVQEDTSTLSCWRYEYDEKKLPIIEGFLMRRNPAKSNSVWQWRWYRLERGKLYCYEDRPSDMASYEQTEGVLQFGRVPVMVSVCEDLDAEKWITHQLAYASLTNKESDPRTIFQLDVGPRTLHLKADNHHNMMLWVTALESHLNVKKSNKWKFSRIPQTKFSQIADTGDILLFTSKDALAGIQRTFTWSNYDHVGLVIRHRGGRLAVLEATGEEGVAITSWNEFVHYKWYELYRRIVLRRLIGGRTPERLQQLQSFIFSVVGKPYGLSAKKLFRRKDADDSVEDAGSKGDFFCSELVAGALKSMEILSDDMSASAYWPVHFSEKHNIQLQHGAHLGEELLIDFGGEGVQFALS